MPVALAQGGAIAGSVMVMRAALICDGTLGEDAVVAAVLEARGLRRFDTAHQRGDAVAFEGDRHEGIRRHVPYRVEGVDAPAGIVRLFDPEKGDAVDWQPQRWGADVAEAFTEAHQEFRTGTRCSSPATMSSPHRVVRSDS